MMVLERLQASAITIPFKSAFKHASALRTTTQTIWVEARGQDGLAGFGEGCPREYVSGETIASARVFVDAYRRDWLQSIHDPESLASWVTRHRSQIDQNPAAWTAVELALLDLMGKGEGRSVESLLGLTPLAGRFRYTAVLGNAPPEEFEAQLTRYMSAGFRDYKIKLSGDLALDSAKVRALTHAGITPDRVRADANNLWEDADVALRNLGELGFPFFALEEPLHAGDYAGMERICAKSGSRIILDESLLRTEQLDRLGNEVDRWILNVRVSKMGGLLRSLELVHAARQCGLQLIVGAHVGETSVLARAALAVANAGREIVIGQEGAAGTHLLEYDMVEPPIIFGQGGILDIASLGIGNAPGFGLRRTRNPANATGAGSPTA